MPRCTAHHLWVSAFGKGAHLFQSIFALKESHGYFSLLQPERWGEAAATHAKKKPGLGPSPAFLSYYTSLGLCRGVSKVLPYSLSPGLLEKLLHEKLQYSCCVSRFCLLASATWLWITILLVYQSSADNYQQCICIQKAWALTQLSAQALWLFIKIQVPYFIIIYLRFRVDCLRQAGILN